MGPLWELQVLLHVRHLSTAHILNTHYKLSEYEQCIIIITILSDKECAVIYIVSFFVPLPPLTAEFEKGFMARENWRELFYCNMFLI